MTFYSLDVTRRDFCEEDDATERGNNDVEQPLDDDIGILFPTLLISSHRTTDHTEA
jgi:hypothetical protein